MASFGYRPPTFGAYPHAPGANPRAARRYTGGVASALAGRSPLQGGTGYGGYGPTLPGEHGSGGGVNAYQPQQPQSQAQPQQPRPPAQGPQQPTPGAYDLDTDPILQQITAFTGMGDEQANAAALKQRQQLALGYGSSDLARSLGLGDEYATAAGANPFSALASLGHQHDVGLHDLTEGYNQNNLFYSGARVLGEQEDARNYQQALAEQAGAVNQGLDTIAGNLSGALGQNQQTRMRAQQDAFARQLQEALAGGYGYDQTGGGASGPTPGGGTGWDTSQVFAGLPSVPAGPVFNPGGVLEGAANYNRSLQQAAPTPDPYLQRLALARALRLV